MFLTTCMCKCFLHICRLKMLWLMFSFGVERVLPEIVLYFCIIYMQHPVIPSVRHNMKIKLLTPFDSLSWIWSLPKVYSAFYSTCEVYPNYTVYFEVWMSSLHLTTCYLHYRNTTLLNNTAEVLPESWSFKFCRHFQSNKRALQGTKGRGFGELLQSNREMKCKPVSTVKRLFRHQ